MTDQILASVWTMNTRRACDPDPHVRTQAFTFNWYVPGKPWQASQQALPAVRATDKADWLHFNAFVIVTSERPGYARFIAPARSPAKAPAKAWVMLQVSHQNEDDKRRVTYTQELRLVPLSDIDPPGSGLEAPPMLAACWSKA